MAEAMQMVEPRVCLVDATGELASVRGLLNELGIAWSDDAASRDRLCDLLVTTPQVAVADGGLRARTGAATHIVVGQNLSRTLRKELERHPCDFVVELPVDPTALRALIEHSLYTGPERRHGLRAMIGGDVKVKAGFWSRKATLVQLSERGAGLLLDQLVSQDEVTLRLPTAWTAGRKVELRARLLDQHMREGEGNVASFTFSPVDAPTRKLLREIMKAQARHGGLIEPGGHGLASGAGATGAAAKRPAASGTPMPSTAPVAATSSAATSAPPSRETDAADGADKRRSARKSFHKRFLATLRGQAQAVTSRDISAGGMRLAPDPEIGEGDELKLALYGGKGSPPLVLRGVVVHADSATGLGLEFVDVPDRMQERLDAIVSGSPISGPVDSTSGRSKVVVTEIVDRVGADEG